MRVAKAEDARRIIELAGQLGYRLRPTRAHATLVANSNRAVLVSTVADEVVGWIALAQDDSLLGEGDAWIEGLVVDETHRGHGIGGKLLAAAHEWARQRGCTRMRVRSNVVREGAHRFYERAGYRRFKTQHNFEYRL